MAPMTITLRDIDALALRLSARALDRLLNDNLRADLRLAGRLIGLWRLDGTVTTPTVLEENN
jgi:hypothetical protein